MDLGRGVLARIDRKLLAGFGQDETYRMVRVPVTASKWATWKRYCESAGVSMGRAIVTLIDRELVSVFDDDTGDHPPVLAKRAEEELAARQEQVAGRGLDAAVAEERLRAWNEHLRRWEGEFETRERRVEVAAKMAAEPSEVETKVGRNERCPCVPQGHNHRSQPVRLGVQCARSREAVGDLGGAGHFDRVPLMRRGSPTDAAGTADDDRMRETTKVRRVNRPGVPSPTSRSGLVLRRAD